MDRILIIGGIAHRVIPPRIRKRVRHLSQRDMLKRRDIPTADVIVVMTKWVNHKQVEVARAANPNAQMLYCNGGSTALNALFAENGL